MIQKKFCLSTFFYYFCFLFTFLLLSTKLVAQNRLWTAIDQQLVTKEKIANLKTYQLFQLNEMLFLEKVNTINTSSRQSAPPTTISLPTHTSLSMDLVASPIIPKKLNAKYPSIQSYQITSKEKPNLYGRISWTSNGLYGHIIDDKITFFIENIAEKGQENLYIIYKSTDLVSKSNQALTCGNHSLNTIQQVSQSFPRNNISNTDLKTFRIAITATEEFTNATGGTVEATLSSIINSLTSLNVIYERDAGIRFMLYENNEQLIFTDERPSPFEDSQSAFDLLTKHTSFLDSLIGAENYDVGHVFSADCTGGVSGVAFLASVCSSTNKARGVSCIFNENIADFRRTLYHEIGHQLGANHTWSNCGGPVNDRCGSR